jgi:hypothetical protein
MVIRPNYYINIQTSVALDGNPEPDIIKAIKIKKEVRMLPRWVLNFV